MPPSEHQTGPVDVPMSSDPVPRDPGQPPGGDDLARVVDEMSTAPGLDDVRDQDVDDQDADDQDADDQDAEDQDADGQDPSDVPQTGEPTD